MTNVNEQVSASMTIKLSDRLPELQDFEKGIRRAPKRELTLNEREIKLALKNALRYIPETLHEQLAPEFLNELYETGRPFWRDFYL